jgi:3-oxoacid CoA-transferase B subunit
MPAETTQEKTLLDKPRLTREQIAQRAALELPDGAYVNLGWGIPNLIADYLPKEITVYFHSENGILGMGRRAKPGEEDYDLVDAMKVPVTLIPGASFFHQADAHLMTRGGHLDVAVLGGFQVSKKGDLANWKIPGAKGSGGIGGAIQVLSVANGGIRTAPAVYQTDAQTLVAFTNSGNSHCSGNNITALNVAAGGASPMSFAWCAGLNGGGAPIVTTTDGKANAIVWTVGAEGDNALHGFSVADGKTVFSGAGTAMSGLHHFQTILATRDRFYVAGDNNVYAFKWR